MLFQSCLAQGSTSCPSPHCPSFPRRLTCFGLESSPSRLDFRSWKEKKVTAGVRADPGQGSKGSGSYPSVTFCQRAGPRALPALGSGPGHHPFTSAFTAQDSSEAGGEVRGGVRLPAHCLPWHPGLFQAERVSGEEAGIMLLPAWRVAKAGATRATARLFCPGVTLRVTLGQPACWHVLPG